MVPGALAVALLGRPASAEPSLRAPAPQNETAVTSETMSPEERLCELIERAADTHGIPADFFTRLLWKESRFDSNALSPKGAQGIAQFMPATAEERGLLDPFDVTTAIPASASYLADLEAQFGNLGLAAAAYNAGPERVAGWLDDASTLPWETQDFVLSITGIHAATWSDPEALAAARIEDDKDEACTDLVAALKLPDQDLGPTMATASGPWGVQVAGNFSRARAMRAYAGLQQRFSDVIGDRPPMVIGARAPGRGARVFYRARVPMQSREEAEALCTKIRTAGGSCIVLKT
jgi:hypothetical protein